MAAFNLYVRGASGAVLVPDLGVTIATGSWTQLNTELPGNAAGGGGQFTAREIRDSADLKALIGAGTLEWSKNGSTAEAAGDYIADFMLMQDFTDDHLDLTSGILTVPNGDEPPPTSQEGNIWWDAQEHGLYMYDGNEWLLVATASGVSNDHGLLTGLGDDDHPQYHDGSLPWTGNLNMGGYSISGVNLVDGVDVSSLGTQVSGIQSWIDNFSDNDTHNHDHGTLSGLADDDHTQYALLGGSLVRNVFTGGASFSTASGLILPTAVDRTGLATVEGNLMFDSDNNQLWVYDGDNWMSIPMMLSGVLTHASLSGLGADDHPQYHDGSLPFTGNLNMGGNSISGVNLVDGVDVSACCAVVSGLVTTVSGLSSDLSSHTGDSSIHFTVSSIDHTLIQNIGTNSHSAIDSHIADGTIHFTVSSIDHGLLQGLGDDDHPQYTEWNNTETISGLWTFDTGEGVDSLILKPKAAAPGSVQDGGLAIIGGVLYAYDATRSTYLSVDRKQLIASRNGAATNLYMRVGGDGVASSETGIRMMRDGTIVGLFAQTSSAKSWTFEVRKAGVAIATLAVTGTGAQATNTNIDFSAGEVLQFYVNGTTVPFPVAGAEIAWRLEPAL